MLDAAKCPEFGGASWSGERPPRTGVDGRIHRLRHRRNRKTHGRRADSGRQSVDRCARRHAHERPPDAITSRRSRPAGRTRSRSAASASLSATRTISRSPSAKRSASICRFGRRSRDSPTSKSSRRPPAPSCRSRTRASRRTITDSAIARLPTLNRNFTDFVVLSPQVSTKGPGLSGGGQNNRFNAIQIDGAVANDLFGLSSTLQPGGLAGAKQVSLEAIKEYQILLSPYDVRQGNFTGFLVNAVTKSGSNEFHSTGTYSTRTEKMERNVSYLRASPFKQSQEGFWFGGPIIKDKLLFSVAPEFQQQKAPNIGPYLGQPSNMTTKPPATAGRGRQLHQHPEDEVRLRRSGQRRPLEHENPLANLFARARPHQPAGEQPPRRALQLRRARKQDVVSTRSATRLALSNNGYTITDGDEQRHRAALLDVRQRRHERADRRATPTSTTFAQFRFRRRSSSSRASRALRRHRQRLALGRHGELVAGQRARPEDRRAHRQLHATRGSATASRSARRTSSTRSATCSRRTRSAISRSARSTRSCNNTPSSATLGIKLDNSDGAAHFTARSLAFYA